MAQMEEKIRGILSNDNLLRIYVYAHQKFHLITLFFLNRIQIDKNIYFRIYIH